MKTPFDLEMERAAIHEAGHAIASVHLGVPFDYVEIAQDGTGALYLPEELDVGPSQLTLLAQKQVIVAFAGPAAQRLFFPHQPEREIRQCSEDDHRKIKAVAQDFPGLEIGKQAEASAKAIVEKFQSAVKQTAEMLLKENTLSFADVKHFYAKSDY
jgi:ATP-dependent Zn protease